jgi:Tetratricopeptide repeat
VREPVALAPPVRGVMPERLGDRHQAQGWFEAERQVLLGAVILAAQHGFGGRAWQLAWAMAGFLDWRRQLNDRPGEAHTWDSLGYIAGKLGTLGQAADCHRRALEIFRELGDRYEEAQMLTRLGDIHHTSGDHLDAVRSGQHLPRGQQDGRGAQAAQGEDSRPEPKPACGTDHEQASMIRRYITWRNNRAYDERLRRMIDRVT